MAVITTEIFSGDPDKIHFFTFFSYFARNVPEKMVFNISLSDGLRLNGHCVHILYQLDGCGFSFPMRNVEKASK